MPLFKRLRRAFTKPDHTAIVGKPNYDDHPVPQVSVACPSSRTSCSSNFVLVESVDDGRPPLTPGSDTPTLTSRRPSNATPPSTDNQAATLREELRSARIEDAAVRNSFYIPRMQLWELINVHIVINILSAHIEDRDRLNSLAENVCIRARAVFAILVLLRKEAEIQLFIDEGILDNQLPLKRRNGDSNFILRRDNGMHVASLRDWTSRHREKFDQLQWWFMAPVFRDLEHYELSENVMLPKVNLSEELEMTLDNGGYSEVFGMRIHPDHHEWSAVIDPESQGPKVAVKRLNQAKEDDFRKERDILVRLTPKPHPHLIKLLSTFRQGQKWHFVFPFANYNLRAYWEHRSFPDFNLDTMIWSVKQMAGIAGALDKIHKFRVSVYLDVPENLSNEVSVKMQHHEKLYGRHGDIKPENFLWFERAPDVEDPLGVLQLADFGLGRFHGRESRSRDTPHAYSPTYEPPECKIKQPISRAYDVWSLGCVYLEFVTWLVLGFQAIEGFSDHRSEFNQEGIDDDNFFSVVPPKHPLGRHSRRSWVDKLQRQQRSRSPQLIADILELITRPKQAVVRHSVLTWVDKLHRQPRSSQLIHDLLSLIMGSMVVVETKERIKSKDLHQRLNEMLNKAMSDESYVLTPVPYED